MPDDLPRLIAAPELELLVARQEARLIDTRQPSEYLAGHIEGAVNLPGIFTYLATGENGGLAGLAEHFGRELSAVGISRDRAVVIYENGWRTGYGQSCRGYIILNFLGHRTVRILHGGLAAWRQASLPLVTDASSLVRTDYRPAIDPSQLVTHVEVQTALGSSSAILLDCRDEEEWSGRSSSPYGRDFCPRRGRIRGAVWLEWHRLMREVDGFWQFQPASVVTEECRRVGIEQDSQVIVYCFKGSRAANTQVALWEAGIKQVKNYFGGWNEWSRVSALPIDDREL